jgi:hypothetical protein
MRHSRPVVGWVIVAVVAALVGTALLVQAKHEPQIQFDETSFDFGQIYQNQEISHEFAFRNAGGSTLEIGKVTSTCGCAAAMPTKRELAAGETGVIRVTFRSGRYRNRVTKHVYVDTNDAERQRLVLTITAMVKVEAEVSPASVYVGVLKPGETIGRSVVIRAVEAKSFKILEIKGDKPLVQVGEPERLRAPEVGYRLSIGYGPTEKAGVIRANVIVKTDLEHTKEIRIPIYGRIAEPEEKGAAPASN